jgi:poly-gamma-glutamate capsule biosynthesis protein CapA/YwtB (metallophosphatase superfamily)
MTTFPFHKVRFFYALLFICFCFSSSCQGSPVKEKPPAANTESSSQKNSKGKIPLIVLGSFLNTKASYPLSEIRSGIEKGAYYVTADIAEEVKSALGGSRIPSTIAIDSFVVKKDSSLLITTLDSVSNLLLSVSVDSISFFKNPESYTFWMTSDQDSFSFEKEITSYTHTGVTAITRQTGVVVDRIGTDAYLKNVVGLFKGVDLLHMSNEVSMVEQCYYAQMKLQFATKKAHFDILTSLGADIIELTGNHNLDFGKDAYLNSLEWYRQNQMRYFGGGADVREAGRPLIIELKDGAKVAWVGYNEFCPLGECAIKGPGAMRYNYEEAKYQIDSLKRKAEVSFVLACVQFGETDSYSPTGSQKKICKELIDSGADVVIGSQAHQAQEIAIYNGKPIFYGLGNFLFDQIHRKGVRQAFWLDCYFYKGRIIQFHPVYTYMSEKRIPSLANKQEKEEIRKAILKPENF